MGQACRRTVSTTLFSMILVKDAANERSGILMMFDKEIDKEHCPGWEETVGTG